MGEIGHFRASLCPPGAHQGHSDYIWAQIHRVDTLYPVVGAYYRGPEERRARWQWLVYKDFLEEVEFEAGFGGWGEFMGLGEGRRVSVQVLVRSQDSHIQLCGMCTAQLPFRCSPWD